MDHMVSISEYQYQYHGQWAGSVQCVVLLL